MSLGGRLGSSKATACRLFRLRSAALVNLRSRGAPPISLLSATSLRNVSCRVSGEPRSSHRHATEGITIGRCGRRRHRWCSSEGCGCIGALELLLWPSLCSRRGRAQRRVSLGVGCRRCLSPFAAVADQSHMRLAFFAPFRRSCVHDGWKTLGQLIVAVGWSGRLRDGCVRPAGGRARGGGDSPAQCSWWQW